MNRIVPCDLFFEAVQMNGNVQFDSFFEAFQSLLSDRPLIIRNVRTRKPFLVAFFTLVHK